MSVVKENVCNVPSVGKNHHALNFEIAIGPKLQPKVENLFQNFSSDFHLTILIIITSLINIRRKDSH